MVQSWSNYRRLLVSKMVLADFQISVQEIPPAKFQQHAVDHRFFTEKT
jgi:hypothetical protein